MHWRLEFELIGIVSLVVSIGSCISSSKEIDELNVKGANLIAQNNELLARNDELLVQNNELRREVSNLRKELACQYHEIADGLEYIKGKLMSDAEEKSLIELMEEREKNTLFALKKYDEKDYKLALKYAKKGDLGNSNILFMLGWMHYEGTEMEKSLKEAFNCWNKAADAGNAKAQFDLAVMYAKGEYVKKNLVMAAKYLKMAAESGLPIAAFHLGLVYETGRGVKRSGRKAIEWYEKAFVLGYPHAGYHISKMYKVGCFVERDLDKARIWLLIAAESGDAYATECVAVTAPIVVDAANDIDDESMLYKMAKKGSFVARNRIITAYEYGIEVECDMSKAYKWCVEAAEDGNEVFQVRAGDMCLSGAIKGRNARDAYRWYKMASEGESVFPDVYYKLGCLYMCGNGVEKDEKRAVELFFRADAENDGLEEAQVALGDAYREGRGVDKNMNEALNWYAKAADADNERAFLRLGNIYEKGDGVVVDHRLAAKYYKKAIDKAFDDEVEEEAQKGLLRVTGEHEKSPVGKDSSS